MFDYHGTPEKEMLERHPEIAPYFHDIDRHTSANAFNNTSHSPERRGAGLRASYALELLSDKNNVIAAVAAAQRRGAEIVDYHESILTVWFTGHRAGLKSKYLDYLYSHSRVASSFICGPANFPVARNRKRSDAADRKYEAIGEFRQLSIKRVLKELLPFGDGTSIKSNDPNASSKIQGKIESLETQRDHMKKVNAIVRKYYKHGSPEVTPEQREQCRQELAALTGQPLAAVDTMLKPNYMGRVIPFEPYEFSNLGAEIRRLKTRTEEVEQIQSTTINDEFANGISVDLSDDQKICIHFGFKPDEATRTTLKRHAFKWSRARTAWVRKLTSNAQADYNNQIKPLLQAL